MMFLRKRCRFGAQKRLFLFLLFLLAFLFLTATLLIPTATDLDKEKNSLPAKYIPKEAFQVDFGEPQEILNTQEDSEQDLSMEGLSPFISLREDELLEAAVLPTAKKNFIKTSRGYRMVKQQMGNQEKDVQGQGSDFMAQSLSSQYGERTKTDELALQTDLETRGFNEAIRRQTSLHSDQPEVRHPLCLQQEPGFNLPTACAIICCHDEAWSTLLRTVHSIMDTAPNEFLK